MISFLTNQKVCSIFAHCQALLAACYTDKKHAVSLDMKSGSNDSFWNKMNKVSVVLISYNKRKITPSPGYMKSLFLCWKILRSLAAVTREIFFFNTCLGSVTTHITLLFQYLSEDYHWISNWISKKIPNSWHASPMFFFFVTVGRNFILFGEISAWSFMRLKGWRYLWLTHMVQS